MTVVSRVVYAPSLGFDFDVLAHDTFISPAIHGSGWATYETFLFRQHLEPGCRVVDLGANIGWFAVHAILAGAEVHAFEPVPYIADLCEANMRRAEEHGSGRGILHRLAAGERRGRARIELATDNMGDNRIIDSGMIRPADMGGGESIEIDVAPVDELVDGPIHFLKVDTQGSEWYALCGARSLLDASPDVALLLELWSYALRGATARQLLAYLAGLGFALGEATDAPYRMTVERILRNIGNRDWIANEINLYGVRGRRSFHVTGVKGRVRALLRSVREI